MKTKTYTQTRVNNLRVRLMVSFRNRQNLFWEGLYARVVPLHWAHADYEGRTETVETDPRRSGTEETYVQEPYFEETDPPMTKGRIKVEGTT